MARRSTSEWEIVGNNFCKGKIKIGANAYRTGTLWKTPVTFTAYRDRSMPEARAAIHPFKRLFQTAMIDEDIEDATRVTSILYLSVTEAGEHEGWYIDTGAVTHSSASAGGCEADH